MCLFRLTDVLDKKSCAQQQGSFEAPLLIRQPDDGHRNDGKMLLRNKNM
jgi:hypothetical protein